MLATAQNLGVSRETAVHAEVFDPDLIPLLTQHSLLFSHERAGQDQHVGPVPPDRDLITRNIQQ